MVSRSIFMSHSASLSKSTKGDGVGEADEVVLGYYPILDGLTVVPVQLFFAERAVRINGNSLLITIVSGILM